MASNLLAGLHVLLIRHIHAAMRACLCTVCSSECWMSFLDLWRERVALYTIQVEVAGWALMDFYFFIIFFLFCRTNHGSMLKCWRLRKSLAKKTFLSLNKHFSQTSKRWWVTFCTQQWPSTSETNLLFLSPASEASREVAN